MKAPRRELCRDKSPLLLELAQVLEADEGFRSSSTLREQCFHACRILRHGRDEPVPYSFIGALLNIDKSTVRKQERKLDDPVQFSASAGRPRLLDGPTLESLRQHVIARDEQRCPPSLSEISRFLKSEFGLAILPNTLSHILQRDPAIKSCKGVPIDAKRIEVTIDQIRDYFSRLFAPVSGAPAHFVFSMDEMGHQEWADAPDKVCFVPVSHRGDHVFSPVSRTGKRITLLACVAADGSFLKPAVVIPRKTYDEDLLLFGMTPEKVQLYSQGSGYIITAIFADWLQSIFIPELERRRETQSYTGPPFLSSITAPPTRVATSMTFSHTMALSRYFYPLILRTKPRCWIYLFSA
jgi:hypothetical protein